MLTSVSDANKQISGLKFGADDYIVKPFVLPNLLARIEALLRRSTWNKEEKHVKALPFVKEGKISPLTQREKEILSLGAKGETNSKIAKLTNYKNRYENRTIEKIGNDYKVKTMRFPRNDKEGLPSHFIFTKEAGSWKIKEESMTTNVQTFLNAK